MCLINHDRSDAHQACLLWLAFGLLLSPAFDLVVVRYLSCWFIIELLLFRSYEIVKGLKERLIWFYPLFSCCGALLSYMPYQRKIASSHHLRYQRKIASSHHSWRRFSRIRSFMAIYSSLRSTLCQRTVHITPMSVVGIWTLVFWCNQHAPQSLLVIWNMHHY